MKKSLLYFLVFISLLICNQSHAQSFTVLTDTIYITATPGAATYFDSIITGTSPVTYSWKVIDCDFPADWLSPAHSGFCDDVGCRYLSVLWPSSTLENTISYLPADTSVLDLALDLTTSSTLGCYYVTVKLHNIAIPTDSATETFIICFTGSLITPGLNEDAQLVIYPNPVNDELNLVFDKNMGAASIKIIDVFGREVINKTTVNTTNRINLNNIPKGFYYLQLFNASGDLLAVKKFAKQ